MGSAHWGYHQTNEGNSVCWQVSPQCRSASWWLDEQSVQCKLNWGLNILSQYTLMYILRTNTKYMYVFRLNQLRCILQAIPFLKLIKSIALCSKLMFFPKMKECYQYFFPWRHQGSPDGWCSVLKNDSTGEFLCTSYAALIPLEHWVAASDIQDSYQTTAQVQFPLHRLVSAKYLNQYLYMSYVWLMPVSQ